MAWGQIAKMGCNVFHHSVSETANSLLNWNITGKILKFLSHQNRKIAKKYKGNFVTKRTVGTRVLLYHNKEMVSTRVLLCHNKEMVSTRVLCHSKEMVSTRVLCHNKEMVGTRVLCHNKEMVGTRALLCHNKEMCLVMLQ